MKFERELLKRSDSKCELCGSSDKLEEYLVPDSPNATVDCHLLLCEICMQQIGKPDTADENHWRMLNDTIWSELPAVQVLSWRMLHKLNQFTWVQDLLDMAYLEEDVLEWAKASGDHVVIDEADKHKDCFGAELKRGDNVVITKTLEVKGATFDAKVGTVVHNIKLVEGNPEQIEGRVNNSMIVILTKYVRKSN